VEEWLQQVDNHATEKVIVFLVGNKCDLKLERVVQRE
jgi:GTPase SAR1 family protein